ncbi:S-layer homology domain-containing protein [Marinicrinis lubricantis]|uniref:S-layer homology domain-containing protein n=1 Tax=Marinicrinis lubricantis TaxID=2086470 RepID=A0ABW1IJT0_9BACL
MNMRFGRRKNHRKTGMLLSLIMTIIMAWSVMPPIHMEGAVKYVFSRDTSKVELDGKSLYTYKHHAVWHGFDPSWNTQIFYRNLQTGQELQITDHGQPAKMPVMTELSNGDIVIIWMDKREYAGQTNFNWDVYSYNLTAGIEKKLSSGAAENRVVTADGNYAVWFDARLQITLYNLQTNEASVIGEGYSPIVKDGKVMFNAPSKQELKIYDIASGQTETAVQISGSEYIRLFQFNGERAVWKQRDNATDLYKYVSIESDDPSAVPIDLTQPVKKEREYLNLYIGDKNAAWLEDVGGSPQLFGANLEEHESYQMTFGTERPDVIGFTGDQLVTRSAANLLVYTSIRRMEIPDATFTPSEESSGWFDAQGGVLESTDGTVKVVVPAQAFAERTKVTLKPKSNAEAEDAMTPVTSLWTMEIGGEAKLPLQLHMSYANTDLTAAYVNKLGIYRADEQPDASLEYIGGSADEDSRTVQADVMQSGTYGLFMYEPSFQDVKGHWGQSYIETLAARWKVSGVGEDKFGPNQTLTRAEFTKMLADATGMTVNMEAKANAHFADMSSHWSNPWVAAAVEAGWVNGVDGKFLPNRAITREEMMVMLIQALGYENEAQMTDQEMNQLLQFNDAKQISGWAKQAAALAVKHQLIMGSNGLIAPKDISTRAEAAVVMYKVLMERGELVNE